MANAVLSEEEKARIRRHLGYFTLNAAPSIQLGFPRASQPLFLVDQAFDQIPDYAVSLIRGDLAILDNIEVQLVEAQKRFKADKLGDLTINRSETDQLRGEYVYWAQRLADDLGCPLNIYAERFRAGGGNRMPINIRVRN